jgi:ParB family chromosome partitioning protein
MLIRIDAIAIGSTRRKVAPAKVKELMVSIETIGLRTPITVRPGKQDGRYVLVTGRHRLESYKRLGREQIEATVMTDKLEAGLWEIAENFHRSELTAMQRSVLVGRWVKLQAQKLKRDQRDAVVLSPRGTKLPRNGGRPESGINAAARELGISKQTAHRAVKIATKLKPAAQKVAAELGLENKSHVLEHASRRDKLEQQIAYLRDYRASQVEQERLALQMADILAGTTPPRDAEDAFRKWFRMLSGEMKGKVRTWLRQLDPIALADDLDARAVLTRDDLARLN